ncbi:oligopeptide transport system substrate-binding protein [Spiroplasma chinense]|uniref:Oligopeptide transport system substrate-binding protein n=1 Tax=Spiroplasma chinense TaxID=216932 RepID=A0A5B9Y3X6_9MOLU|nr:ABC transporter substrate-binding protein [Spiroplasma chinense]QEH61505.1 oligopeptide transport system substrate-binding protein [Spiroplasma chinense]
MEIKLKRILSAFAASSIIATTTTSVVACQLGGFNFNAIRNRKVNTKEYLDYFQTPPEVWSPIVSASRSDSMYLANIFATILSVDEYGRTYGDLVESGFTSAHSSDGGKSLYVGADSNSATVNLSKWKYKFRKEAKWFKADGTAVRDIKPSDILNSAKYVLNPANTVPNLFLWRQFIRGASELYTYFENNASASMDQALKAVKEGFTFTKDGVTTTIDPVEGGFGIIVDDTENTVEFNLLKPSPYFESLLTYSVFSPTPIENYAQGETGKVVDPSKTLFSGPYLVSGDPRSGSTMDYVKNNGYYFADKTEIEKLTYKKVSTVTSDLGRTMFETGETLQYGINPNDAVGWDRYVGKDLDKPNIDEVSVGKPMNTTSYILSYNMNYKSGDVTDQKLIDGSRLLQSKAARILLNTGFNRSVVTKYFSAKYDTDPNVSQNIRNTFSPPELSEYGGIDYVKRVENAVKEKFPKAAAISDFSLDDGNEILLGKQDLYTDYATRAQLTTDVQAFVDSNQLTKNSRGKVELRWVASDSSNTTLNPYITRAVAQFNEIPNNPIEINFDILNNADYMTAYGAGDFHLFQIGWIPDYNDPGTFLGALIIDGDLIRFTGLSTIDSSNNPLLLPRNNPSEGMRKENLSYVINDTFKTTESDDVVTFAEDYTDKFLEIDGASTYDPLYRFDGFGKIEAEAIYENFLILPNFTNAAPITYSISFVRPFTYGYATYGISSEKIFTYRINEQLWTKEQNDEYRHIFRAEKAIIDLDPSYKKDGNIFFRK